MKWTFDASATILIPPVISDGLVLLKTDALFIAVSATTGKKAWEVSAPTSEFPIAFDVSNTVLLFASDRGTIVNAVSLRDGRRIWSESSKGFFDPQITRVTLDESQAYIARGRPATVRAHRLTDGEFQWESQYLNSNAIKLTLRGDELFVLNGGSLHVLDTRTGLVKKQLIGKFPGNYLYTVFDGSDVYLNSDGIMICRDVETGQIRWQLKENARLFTVLDDRVYASTEHRTLLAVDRATGHLLWQQELDANSISYVTQLASMGYVVLEDGSILGFDLASGKRVGRIQTEPKSVGPYRAVQGSQTDGESLYASFGDSKLFAFGK